MLRLTLLFAAGCVYLTHMVSAYETGAPPEACDNLTPQHGDAKAKTTKAPYLIHVGKTRIRPGESVDITLKGIKNDDMFKGFLIQARVGTTPVGKFSIPSAYANDVKLLSCSTSNGNSVTHTSKKDKKEITVTWTAPSNLSETVIFYYTVAKNGGEFWVAEKSRTVVIH